MDCSSSGYGSSTPYCGPLRCEPGRMAADVEPPALGSAGKGELGSGMAWVRRLLYQCVITKVPDGSYMDLKVFSFRVGMGHAQGVPQTHNICSKGGVAARRC